jgi:hypothetical protein
MTQQNWGRNNITISKVSAASVPIVSRTEIDLMKTALSVMLSRHDDAARTEAAGPGGACSHGYLASGSFCMPSSGAADAIANPGNGTCRDGFRAGATACETGDAINRIASRDPRSVYRDLVTHRFK